jgi:hypothetical protein
VRQTITTSICSLSWIDAMTGLPEHDNAGPPTRIPGRQITMEGRVLPYRFLNLLEVMLIVDGSRITSATFTPASKIYRNPSFLDIPPQTFKTFQNVKQQHDCVTFEQTVGARTVSPEVIGQVVGTVPPIVEAPPGLGVPISRYTGKLGRAVAHELLGFPPIWTQLSLKVFVDGRSEGQVLSYSLFPSMSFYRLTAVAAASAGGSNIQKVERIAGFYDRCGAPYDARANLDRWKTEGWGALQIKPFGPCKGNPWGYNKGDLTVRPTSLDHRLT